MNLPAPPPPLFHDPAERCMIIFDDTFQLGNGLYSGKGGAAMAFLLANQRFEVVKQSRFSLCIFHYPYLRTLPTSLYL